MIINEVADGSVKRIAKLLAFAAVAVLGLFEPLPAGFELATGPTGIEIRIRVDDEELLKSPSWRTDAPNPPLSAKKAIQLATTLKEKLVPDTKSCKWRFMAAKLCHDHSVDRWYWEVDFEAKVRLGLVPNYPEELRLIVLMDGTIVQPVATPTSPKKSADKKPKTK